MSPIMFRLDRRLTSKPQSLDIDVSLVNKRLDMLPSLTTDLCSLKGNTSIAILFPYYMGSDPEAEIH
jgi:hypothetical protein